MKQRLIKITALLIFAVMLFGTTISAGAAALTHDGFLKKLEEVKAMYPEGSQKYEWKVNGTVVGWQCHGYARWISSYVWGTDFANGTGKGWTRYNSTATTTSIDKLVPGDVLRYRTTATGSSNHSIFVTAIEGDTVYFTDCNSDHANTIKWGRTTTKQKLETHLKMQLGGRDYVEYGYIAHYTANNLTPQSELTLKYNANGGYLNLSTKTEVKYTVVDSSGINLRSGPGTSYDRVGAMPKGTVFTVTETAVGGEYTWGKTTYNGITGWGVISREWTTKTETVIPPDYYLNSDGDIYLTATSNAFSESFVFGGTGLLPASTAFGLERTNHTFLGWSKTPDGEAIIPASGFSPDSVFPEAGGKNHTATLYAVWKNNVVLTDIEVEALPAKTVYSLNETLDTSGLKIKLNYSDKSTKSLTEGFTISGFDSSTTGEKLITVQYEGKTATFTLVVEGPKKGDLNGDKTSDLSDVTLLARYLAGWDVECDTTLVDTNTDGYINLKDLIYLSQYVAGWQMPDA